MQFSNMITAVDTHAGEPMRVITGSIVDVPGTTMLVFQRPLSSLAASSASTHLTDAPSLSILARNDNCSPK